MARPSKPRAGQAILPTMARLAKKPSQTPGYRRQAPEARIVDAITDAATALGYRVARVGQGIARGSGTTVGYPDLSIRRRGWPVGVVCLVEVKTLRGRLSEEQQALHDQGWSFVARDARQALLALYRTECVLGETLAASRVSAVVKQMEETK